MFTSINIPLSSLLTLGSSSLSNGDSDTLDSMGTIATSLVTSMTASGEENLMMNKRVENLNVSKAYIRALTREEKLHLVHLLDLKEEGLEQEERDSMKLNMKLNR